jgi:hypothetical protein
MSKRYDNPVAPELRRLARHQLRNELQLIQRSVKGQSKSLSAIRRIDARLKRLSARMERVEKEGSRLVVKVGRALAHVRRSEILLSSRDLIELRALLGVADGRARTRRKHLCARPVLRQQQHRIQTPRIESDGATVRQFE